VIGPRGEGGEPIRRFPESPQELDTYDVVLFGDVDPHGDWLSPEQIRMLLAFVADRGGGFGVLAGPRFAPGAFDGTGLEKLVPVRIDPDGQRSMPVTIETPSRPSLTAAGRQHPLFRFAADDAETWLPGVYWVAPTLGAAPAAEVLADVPAPGAWGARVDRRPLFVLGRYGAGRVFFSGTDDTWRWRRGAGDWAFDAFWLQVCRALAQPGDPEADRRVVLRTDRPRYGYGQRVSIYADVFDPDLLSSLETEFRALVRNQADEPIGRVTLTRTSHAAARYQGTFVPPRPGSYTAEWDTDDPPAMASPVDDRRPTAWGRRPKVESQTSKVEGQVLPMDFGPSTLDLRPPAVVFHVYDSDPERRETHADHAFLRRLAAETGGTLLTRENIVEPVEAILDRSVRIPDDVVEPLWDSKLALCLFVVLITAEWMLRKVFGLL